jgi:elongation factor 1-beta
MGSKSYVEGWQFSDADSEYFGKFTSCPEAATYPHAFRWYIHIAALKGVRGLSFSAPAAAAEAPAKGGDDDDFDVFGDDDDEDDEPQESRKDMLARLKKEAEERTAKKEAKQRTLVGIEIKPWDTEQDLIALWKKITTEVVVMDGLRWAESVNLAEVAFGIKKIQTTFTMGVSQSSQDVQDMIEAMEDEVQSVEIVSMNVL